MIRKEININEPLTPAQIEMIASLEKREVIPTEECPELKPEQLAKFERVSSSQRGKEN